jgi:hypothetical protein
MASATFLPWFTANFGIGPFNRDGLQSWDTARVNLDGVVTVVLGSVTVLLAALRAGNVTRVPARLPVVTAGAVGVLLAYRIPELVVLGDRVRTSYAGLTARVGYGIWLMCAGVLCAVSGGLIVGSRQRDVAHAALAMAGGGLIAASSVMPWFAVDLNGSQFVRNGFQLGNDLGFSVDGAVALSVGLASVAVGMAAVRRSELPTRWGGVPLVAGLVALVLVAGQLPSLEALGSYVTSGYGAGSAGPGVGLDVLVAGAGLAILGGVVARRRVGGFETDVIVVGGLLIAASSVLPWFSVDTGIVPTNLTGFSLGDNGGWSKDGLIILIAGLVIMASRIGAGRRPLVSGRSIWLAMLGVLVAGVVLAYRVPLLFARAHAIVLSSGGRHGAHVGYGVWVVMAGGAIVLLGWARGRGGRLGGSSRGATVAGEAGNRLVG